MGQECVRVRISEYQKSLITAATSTQYAPDHILFYTNERIANQLEINYIRVVRCFKKWWEQYRRWQEVVKITPVYGAFRYFFSIWCIFRRFVKLKKFDFRPLLEIIN